MSAKQKGGGIASLFIRPDSGPVREEESARPTARPEPARFEGSSDGPEVISSLVPGGASVPVRRKSVPTSVATHDVSASMGPSETVMALVDEVRKHVPTDNPTMKLMEAMKPLAKFLHDPTALKAAALAVLESQGVTAKDVQSGAKEVEGAIDTCLDSLLAQANQVRGRDVDTRRNEAERLRGEVAELTRKIADLNRQAGELDSLAKASETSLEQFTKDVEAARAHAREVYGV